VRFADNLRVLPEKIVQRTNWNYVLNQPIPTQYKEIFNWKRLNRYQLRIIAGIEIYFGNLSELKFVYAIKEVPELSEFITLLGKQKELQQDAHTIMAKEGIKGLETHQKTLFEAGTKLKESKESLMTKIKLLNEYQITENDILTLEQSYGQ